MADTHVNPNPPDGNKCPQCGTPLPGTALAGLCPACLLKAGASADTVTEGKQPAFTPPTIDELAPLFPQLEILELIGKGGMGAVYKARQKELDRIVALKILPAGIGGDPSFAERFAREARALAKLNHPNIVTLYEFGSSRREEAQTRVPEARNQKEAGSQSSVTPAATERLYYFLMEFVDGVNLRQLLHTSRVESREALAIVPQICDALQFAHDQGIVHRDIKPENILLDRRGNVKVADFGLAKIVEPGVADLPVSPEIGAARQHGPTGVMGTPHYMSPEQIEAPGKVDHRADIYALGVVFYQMLTGELPGRNLEPPSKKVRIDVRLDEVVLRALEKKPELRYQQASVLKSRVETIAETPGSSGRESSQTESERDQTSQSRLTSASTRVGFAAAVTFFYAGVNLSVLLIGVLPFRFSRDSAYLLGVGLMLVTAPFIGVSAANVVRRARDSGNRDRINSLASGLKAASVVAWLLALPVIGFAVFFLYAMMQERGGWNPAASEAVLVPLTWLGAVMLPICGWRLWRAANRPGSRGQQSAPTGPEENLRRRTLAAKTHLSWIAWTTAVGLTVSQAIIEVWKKWYVAQDKAVEHGLYMLALATIFQLGIVLAPWAVRRMLKWRLLVAGLMSPCFLSLLYMIYWHVVHTPPLLNTLPISVTVWYAQLAILPLGVLGYLAVYAHLFRTARRDEPAPAESDKGQRRPASAGIGPSRFSWGRSLLAAGVAAFIIWLLVTVSVSVITFMLPETYKATARIRVDRSVPTSDVLPWSYDPYFIQTEFEIIQSEIVLGRVIDQLKLRESWGRVHADGNGLEDRNIVSMLRSGLELRPVRNTSLIEISYHSKSPKEATQIANAIADSYAQYRTEQQNGVSSDLSDGSGVVATVITVKIIDTATPPLRPVKPNKPLNIAVGTMSGLVLGLVASALTFLLLYVKHRRWNDGLAPVFLATGGHTVAFIVLGILFTLVVSRFTALFAGLDVELPWATQLVMGGSGLLKQFGLLLFPLIVALDFGICTLVHHLSRRRGLMIWSTCLAVGLIAMAGLAVLCVVIPLGSMRSPATTQNVQEATDSTAAWSPTLAPGEKPDPNQILNDAKNLMQRTRYDEALQRYLWFHNHVQELGDSYQNTVRRTSALSDWVELGRRYPRAKEALLDIRDAKTRECAEGRGYADLFQDVASINQYLQAADATVALFKTIEGRDPALAKQCYFYVERTLVERGEYELCLKVMGDPQARFDLTKHMWETGRQRQRHLPTLPTRSVRGGNSDTNNGTGSTNDVTAPSRSVPLPPGVPAPPDMAELADRSFIGSARMLVEILVGAGRKSEAENIRDQAIAVLDVAELQSAVSDAEARIHSQPVQAVQPQSASAHNLSFGPVIERVVSDDQPGATNFLIDLDSGLLVTPPSPREADWNWTVANGIDAIGDRNENVRGLVSAGGTVVVPTARDAWDTFTVADVRQIVAPLSSTLQSGVAMPGTGDLPATFVFKTREGGIGILQITSFTDNPRGVKIRYKLLPGNQ